MRMKKMVVVLVLCMFAPVVFAKPKAKDYPLEFTVQSGMENTAGCYLNLTDGDGNLYEAFSEHSIFGHDCPVWGPGVKVNGRIHHWPAAGTDIELFYYVTQKNKPNKAVISTFKLVGVIPQ